MRKGLQAIVLLIAIAALIATLFMPKGPCLKDPPFFLKGTTRDCAVSAR